jgi:transposase
MEVMRGRSKKQLSMLAPVNLEERVPAKHPLREVKRIADDVLEQLSPTFDAMYEERRGRKSVPPERLLKAMLLIALYSVRSERMFCEQLDYNLLFRWFLDMDLDEDSFDHSTFTRNRDRLLAHDVAGEFFRAVVERARTRQLMSREHFSVDGTLIDSWASLKSFRPKDEDDDDNNGWGGFRGKKRSNATHESKTDPDAKLMRKGNGQPAKLSYAGHALMENRNGLLVDVLVNEANGWAERNGALEMLNRSLPGVRRITLGADRGYDAKSFVRELREAEVTPHIAQSTHRRAATDARTVRHPGYALSLKIRMRIEPIFGWLKSVAGLRRSRLRGIRKTQHLAYLAGAAYNLLRMAKLQPMAA